MAAVAPRPRPAPADVEATTSRQEAELWRATMLHFYGENWQVDLAIEEAHALDRQGA